MKLKLLSFSIISLCLLSLAGCDADYIDSKKEYIINPDLPMLKEFQWATWEDSVGGRMAHDPKWFILPADKYITKEVSFDWNSLKGKSALEKRNTYFQHLCKTEAIAYKTSDYPMDIVDHNSTATSTWFYPRMIKHSVKDMKEVIHGDPKVFQRITYVAAQNPFLFPRPGYRDFKEGQLLHFDFETIDEHYYKMNYGQPKKDTFREYMDNDGDIYRISFDIKTNKFLPLEKITLEESKAQYYNTYREIERPEMKKLGIFGEEGISVDRKNNKLIHYYKIFEMPLYMDTTIQSGYQIPIDWHRSSFCIINTKRDWPSLTE